MLRVWRQLIFPRPAALFFRPGHIAQRNISSMGDEHSASPRPLPHDDLSQGANSKGPQGNSLHSYTGGRWLHRDALQRSSRHIQFDFSALCDKAIRACPGATKVVQHEKREGGFNRVFILTMNNGSCVVARLPTSIAGPPRLTTNSEVATMTYLQNKVELPIPKILDWNDNALNPVGAEYIIQEHVAGVQLPEIWPTMDIRQHMLCTKALSLALKQMASLNFPAYGSLYFSDAPIESNLKIPLDQGFCIGPNCSSVFWNRGPGESALYGGPSPNCGPWKDLTSYYQGLIETGFSRLPKESTIHETLPHQGSIQEHMRLIKASQQVMQMLAEDARVQGASAATLLHPDFHMRNVFVSADDPTVITGLIDWQSTSVEPAFIYANETPDFAAPPEEPDEEVPKTEHSEQQSPAIQEQARKDALICFQTYDVFMRGAIPKVLDARPLDPSLFRVFQYSHTSWRDSATALRQELIELTALWTELGLPGACPFSVTDEELKEHIRDYEDFETVQRLKLWLKSAMNTNSDGWVSNEQWDTAMDAHRGVYEQWMETARENESDSDGMTVAKADKLWPFDAR